MNLASLFGSPDVEDRNSWYWEKRYLQNAAWRYKYNKASSKWGQMQINGEWQSGGMCPWQAFLPVTFKGVKYTIYIRERHGNTSVEVLYGWSGFRRSPKYMGVASDNLLTFEDNDVADSDDIHEKYYNGEEHVDLFERAEILARKFFEVDNKYQSKLPFRRFECDE